MQPAPFLQQLLLGLAKRRIRHAGTCRTYLSTLRGLIGTHALGAPVRIDGVCCADGFIRAPWPTVSAQPGNCSALFSDDFVGYRLSFLSSLAFTIVTFPLCNVNWEAKRPFTNWDVRRGGPPQADAGVDNRETRLLLKKRPRRGISQPSRPFLSVRSRNSHPGIIK